MLGLTLKLNLDDNYINYMFLEIKSMIFHII